eukprot:TRINITY_DN35543_c0_g1_i1.p1 TRINITY_DN35543_c0_g1~~TRINITY_DN35543_c0_g1_i1.p1  ORF type:complete len:357 (+),score=116.58 TRINITY_DN35543_c0_g1_i1:75-1145(+)
MRAAIRPASRVARARSRGGAARGATVALVDVEDDAVERRILSAAGHDVVWSRDPKPRSVSDIPPAERAAVQGLLLRRCLVTDSDLALLPSLRVVLRMGVGVDNIDLAACSRRGLVACNCPEAWVEEVADSAWSLLLCLMRNTVPLALHTQGGEWTSSAPLKGMRRLRGLRLGIVGLGRIGTAAAARASAFGVSVRFYDPLLPAGAAKGLGWRRCGSFEELLGESDVLSLHCPLTERSANMLDSAALAALPPGKGLYVINTARGGVLDEDACAAALRDGRLGGLALDVLAREPNNMSGKEIFGRSALAAARQEGLNVIITPHAAFYSAEAFEEMRHQAAAEIARVLRGEPPWYQVNK